MAKGSLNFEKVVEDIPQKLRTLILFLLSRPELTIRLMSALLTRIKEDDFTTTQVDFVDEHTNMMDQYFNDDGEEDADDR